MENKSKTVKAKRFYKIGEIVWVVGEKQEGKVKSINKESHEVTVTVKKGNLIEELTVKMWEIDKLKYKAKEESVKFKKLTITKNNDLFFAKVKEDAIIPKKAGEEEAGYDVWACLESKIIDDKKIYEFLLPRLKPTLVPTGIATCVERGFYLNFANERGSTGKYGMLILSGIVDSSYRGEVFVNITPLYKNVLITSEVSEVEETDDLILYPYSKAICQLIDYRIGESIPSEITYEKLKSIPSKRGIGALGSSNH